MNVSSPFIKRPVMTSLVMLALTVLGLTCYKLLPVSSIPSLSLPTIEVSTSYPGASADEMARLISSPLERQFMLMQGIQVVASTNTYESSTIVLEFHLDVDINVAAQETEEAINKALAELPRDLPQNPTYIKTNPSDTPVTYLVVHSDTMSAAELYEYGYTFLGQQLGTVNGVADIAIFGYPYAVRVKVDPEALAAKDITLAEVAKVINDENPDLPTGKFYGPFKSIETVSDGQIFKAEKYNSLIIKYQDEAPVRVRDIGYAEASIQNDKQDFRWITKQDEEAVVVLPIYRQNNFNTVEVCDNVAALAEKLATQLPGSIKLDIPYSQAKWIRQAIVDVEITLLAAFCLVVVVIFVYLGKFRNSIIPIISLPITMTGTFILMYLFGYSLDILSLSAFTLSIGFLVDDAIVVLENIVRWIQGGETPYQGALKGSKQICLTVISISLSLAAVFIPILLLQGFIGRIFHEFAAVILIAILFSGFISLTLTPMLCSRFIPKYTEEKRGWFEKHSERLNEFLVKLYKRPLHWVLKHRFTTLCLAVLSIGVSGYLFYVIPRSFLPPTDLGIVQMFVEAQEGTSPERMLQYLESLTKMTIKNPYVFTMARIDSYPTDNQAVAFINLVDRDKRPDIWTFMRHLEEQYVEELIGVRVAMKAYPLINLQIGNMEASKAQYQFLLQSLDEKKLYESATKLIDKMKESTEFGNVSSDQEAHSPSLKINFLRDQAHSYGNLNAKDIENALQYAYGETYISKINRPENMYYVILEAENKYQIDPSKLSTLYLGQNGPVAIDSVIETEHSTAPLTVNHTNALTSVTISFDVAPGVPLSEALLKLQQEAQDTLPASVMGLMAGETKAFEKTSKELVLLLLLAVFVIYIILGILYENFLHPFTALSAVPIAAFGGLLTLIVFKQSLSIYAFIGIIMLLGIVMKNGILVIEFALEEMQSGKNAIDAAFSACVVRFRPILMTTLAAMMGAVPIALGIGGTVAEGRSPLGLVIVGGLIFSQAVTLFITPVIFVVMTEFHDFINSKTELFKHKEGDSK